ncbi:MAG: NAD-dependent epimerase/dehydratase family protein [Candidatus Diapherotrites archaeon]|uniref:NAD-dependent epimerase/dehydratase family protein n=1 Tax=Candidatus Iainarchaeum sp. TaxID=3101447 RepID=A0A7J4IUT7_9ARCH|nr:MAG: hypothetical protein QT03_C0001G0543 [archaeon GW2011_AR10]MBS3058960.1 NAD-dependent epimerase/dehydratase family protein [Candidatus Diapherotrites archaeon]HIH08590.1 NAD-dependent epimerase/dehydratase family protein [Candidatus Diapherotrites archaeon]
MNENSLKEMKGQRVLVLGGLGFFGSNIVHKCVGLGAEVTVFDAMIEPYGFNLANLKGIEKKVGLLKQDMRNFGDLSKAVKEKDLIFNCAGQVSHVDSMKEPFLDIELNIVANLNLLEACRKFNGNAKIVYAGTRAQVGKAEYTPIDEKHPTNPVDVYGIDKLTAEKYLLLYSSAYGIKGVSIRSTNGFGPRHQMKHGLYGILNWFIRLALEGKTISVYGTGEQLRDYLYIDDIVNAMVSCGQSEKANGQIYNVSSGKGIKFIEMVKKIIEFSGKGKYELKPFPEERKMIETGDVVLSYKKINRELGWEPLTSFDDGLKKTIDFYKKHLKEYV